MNDARAHGFESEPQPLTVNVGDTFRRECALGIYESRVLRRHREAGHWETVMERWVTPVPAFRQGFVGGIEILPSAVILEAMRAP